MDYLETIKYKNLVAWNATYEFFNFLLDKCETNQERLDLHNLLDEYKKLNSNYFTS